MENIRRRQQEEKEPLLLAAVRATRQVGFAVFASSAVLVAVIPPLAFLQSNVGLFFREFAVVLGSIVVFSTFAAVTLAPMLSSRLFDQGDRKEGRVARWVGRGMAWLGARYQRSLRPIVRRPWLASLAGLLAAGVGVAAFLALPSELAPDEDRGSVSIVVEAPEGAGIEYTRAKLEELGVALAPPGRAGGGEPAEQVLSILAPGGGGGPAPVNTGRLILRLKPWGDRERGEKEIRQELQKRLSAVLGELDAFAAEELPRDARINYKGESLDFKESGRDIYVILGLVLVLVFLVMAGQFESFRHPLVILLCAPLAIAAGLATCLAFGLTLNIHSQIGMVLLIGLVAKNAALVVEFANQLREEGREAADAIMEAAGVRLRRILMTSVATILGAVPLAIASGAAAESRRTIGLVTAGGLTLGTLLTLFLVPALYMLVSARARVAGETARKIEAMERERPPAEQERPAT